ncbi:MAG TPA: TIM barrel protein [Vicinamibacterales bacterium]|nr:TIM barrel protein [Vicinamibacterales bacterium]
MIRVANAPCSWGILEFESAAAPASYSTVLDEMRDTGYAGTELGDWGFMPTDALELRRELERRQLSLIGAFVPVGLANHATHNPGTATAIRTAALMRDAGAEHAFIVLSDDNGSVPDREQHAGRITSQHGLSERAWSTFAAGAEHIARAVKEATGLRTVFHPHCGGYVETPHEIDSLMSRTDPALLGLVLDTGHIIYGGGDPVDVFNTHADRVWHVHYKDCDLQVAESARAKGLGYLDAVHAQLFCELGTGSADLAAMTDALRRSNYNGWIVVEQDVFPGYGTPKASAQKSRDYLRKLGL